MNNTEQSKMNTIKHYEQLLKKQTGVFHKDSYTNVLNNYGTSKDTTEHYQFKPEPPIPDDMFTSFYESNGLFAKIIDAPAEEAVKHGFELDISDQDLENYYKAVLDDLDWESTAMTAIKWTRLFGGCIVVLITDDDHGLDEPLDWNRVKSVKALRIYDRSIIQEDIASLYNYDNDDSPYRTIANKLGMPEYYDVFSRYGHFRVHESRCLVFQNGLLPENTSNSNYQMWGIPEYIKLNRAVRDAEVAHGSAVKLLDRSIQAIYKMRGLAAEVATEKGEDRILRRLQTIDTARGLLNSIVIDADGEEYDFRTFQYSGVSDVIDTTCNYLSALTNIPQTILFGRSPSGMNSTGESDFENWYNYVERIQKRMLKRNLRYLLGVIFQAGKNSGKITEIPNINVAFNPLWSLSDTEKADLEQKKAQTQQTKAQTAQIYIDAQILDPTEVRLKFAESDEFDIETMLDDYTEEELFENMPQSEEEMPMEGEEGMLPMEMGSEQPPKSAEVDMPPIPQNIVGEATDSRNDADDMPPVNGSVGVLVISNGRVLTGTRKQGSDTETICGPGGHVENGETHEQAAIRETQEEFGITPKSLIQIGYGAFEPKTGLKPVVYVTTDYEGDIRNTDGEMGELQFRSLDELSRTAKPLFQPFKESLSLLMKVLGGDAEYG